MNEIVAIAAVADEAAAVLQRLGVTANYAGADVLIARSPISGGEIGRVRQASVDDAHAAIARAHTAYLAWRKVPAPRRGELIRLFGEELRAAKADLGRLVTLEAGKVTAEGLGEVQELSLIHI